MNIYLIGDSIVTAYGDDSNNFIGGWGDHLQSFFDEKYVNVICCAEGGKSSRSYLNDGRFFDYGLFTTEMFPYGVGPVYPRIKQGDYVFIEFGHNDDETGMSEKRDLRQTKIGEPDSSGTYPVIKPEGEPPYDFENGTYKGYLKVYLDSVKQKGATPVLVTPAARANFVNNKISGASGNHGGTDLFGQYPYVRAMKQLADENNVILLDLFERSKDLMDMLGPEDFKFLQSIIGFDGFTIGEARYDRPRCWPSDYDLFMDNNEYQRVDNTHTNRFGSFIYASFIASEVRDKLPVLNEYILDIPTKNVMYPRGIKSRMNDISSKMYFVLK